MLLGYDIVIALLEVRGLIVLKVRVTVESSPYC